MQSNIDACPCEIDLIDDCSAERLESEYVHDVYDEIANHFSDTRHTAWPKVAEFVKSLHCCDRLLDVGSGNGKNLLVPIKAEPPQSTAFAIRSGLRVASDMSSGLLSVCRQRDLESIRTNCLQLPFCDDSFEAVICIAVLHHLSSEKRRAEALQQIERVLRSSGQALIYVWAFEQKLNGQTSAYIKRKNAEPAAEPEVIGSSLVGKALPVHRNRTGFAQQDMLVPWKSKEQDVQRLRYYHLFRKGELRQLVEQTTQLRVIQDYFDNGNWAVLLSKE